MKKRELMEWAVKGLEQEINKKSMSIYRGFSIMKDLESGQKVETQFNNIGEIRDIIKKLEQEIEVLYKQKEDIKWELETNENL